jgi:hypothetical protein
LEATGGRAQQLRQGGPLRLGEEDRRGERRAGEDVGYDRELEREEAEEPGVSVMSSIQSPADSCEVGGDGAVAGEAGEGERVDDVTDDVGEAAHEQDEQTSEPTCSRSGAAVASACQRKTVPAETRNIRAVSSAGRARRVLIRRIRIHGGDQETIHVGGRRGLISPLGSR